MEMDKGQAKQTGPPKRTGEEPDMNALAKKVASTHIAKEPQFRMGFEVEAVLMPHQKVEGEKPIDRSGQLARTLAAHHNSKTADNPAVAPMQVQKEFIQSVDQPDYSAWMLMHDSSILLTDEVYDTGCPMEIASPILTFDDHGAWRDHVRTVFGLIGDSCKIDTDTSCGFHVHLSPNNRGWNLVELKNICIAILHFESAILELLPEKRRENGPFLLNSLSPTFQRIEPKER